MALTWLELVDHAHSQYALEDDNEDAFSLTFEFEDGRTQKIGVSRFAAFDQEWIEYRTYVCKGDEMAPQVALRKNEELVLGALAIDDDGDYCLLYSVPLDGLERESFDLPLVTLARIADDLEEAFTNSDEF